MVVASQSSSRSPTKERDKVFSESRTSSSTISSILKGCKRKTQEVIRCSAEGVSCGTWAHQFSVTKKKTIAHHTSWLPIMVRLISFMNRSHIASPGPMAHVFRRDPFLPFAGYERTPSGSFGPSYTELLVEARCRHQDRVLLQRGIA